MSFEISDKQLDRICSVLIGSRNRFWPIDETADECLDALYDDTSEVDTRTIGQEHGYHGGMYTAYDEMVNQLYMLGVNVMARANRYVHAVKRDTGTEHFPNSDQQFYRATKGGAEVRALGPLLGPEYIESIEWPAPYEVGH